MAGRCRVHVSVEAGPIKLGRFPGGADAPVKRLADCMKQAGIRSEGSAEITFGSLGKDPV